MKSRSLGSGLRVCEPRDYNIKQMIPNREASSGRPHGSSPAPDSVLPLFTELIFNRYLLEELVGAVNLLKTELNQAAPIHYPWNDFRESLWKSDSRL
jgi:hypothetical protein